METILSNFERAKKRADEIDQEIIKILKSSKSFLVEAGAGSGKTYSLMRVIDWLQENRDNDYKTKKQQIVCITYTNAAVEVIKQRLPRNSSIIPSTIHSFAWQQISRFQSTLVKAAKEMNLFGEDAISQVNYTLGVRDIKEACFYLHHNDVIALFSYMLDYEKFRKILSDTCPVILIDEYQDSFRIIMDKFLKYFIEIDQGPQFGLFGDAWQTIYATNGACGKIQSDHLIEIRKESNFRSQQVIVDVLNGIRPGLPQITASDDKDGKAIVITSDDYDGRRQSGNHYKDELLDNILIQHIDSIKEKLLVEGWNGRTKILILTHRMLSKQQKYENLLSILDESLKDESDSHLRFFIDILEPVFKSINVMDVGALYNVLGTTRRPIETKSQKQIWPKFGELLGIARERTIGEVIQCVIDGKLIPVPPKVLGFYSRYLQDMSIPYGKSTLKDIYNISYQEVINASEFLKPDSLFSTDHGVKGEEFDNVLVVIGRGWNQYKFDEYLYREETSLSDKELDAYIRNRNLFYVCCSRPRKRLALFITVPTNQLFRNYLQRVFGNQNLFLYKEFMQS